MLGAILFNWVDTITGIYNKVSKEISYKKKRVRCVRLVDSKSEKCWKFQWHV